MSQVHWFPNYHDKFIISGSDISLYQIDSRESVLNDNDLEVIKIYNLRYVSQFHHKVTQLSTEIRYQFIKTVAPSYHKDGELLVAAGHGNGKVALLNFLPTHETHIEFTPRQQRPCLSLAWNQAEPNILAMGFEKNKSDHCISIWDIEKGNASESSIISLIGLGETAHSMCWEKMSKILFVGMSQKYIKLLDLRQSQPSVAVANTRAVQGLQISNNNRYLVSYIDNSVNIWDIRQIEKPVSQFNMQKSISNIAWNPTRNNVLTTIHRDSPLMNLIDIHWSGVDNDMDPYFVKRVVSPFEVADKKNKHCFLTKNLSLDYMSWHPSHFERVLLLTNTNLLLDFKVSDRVSIVWDNGNKLWASSGTTIRPLETCSPPSTPSDSLTSWEYNINQMPDFESDDIADLMKRRVMQDYGHFPTIDQNKKIAYTPHLYSTWKILGQMQKSDNMSGLKHVLDIAALEKDQPLLFPTTCESKTWSDFPTSGSIKVYRNEHRDNAQIICGWTYIRGGEVAFKEFIGKLCSRKEHTRAAMLACFNLKVRYAIDILGRGANEHDKQASELRMSAIALAGFNLDKTGIWRSQCGTAYKQIVDPHLRAILIFSFLASESDSFENVLNESGVSLCDRMAFACSFLSDQKLSEFVKKTIQNCNETGDLSGLLMTGNTAESINLLQSYVDKSSDVQTAALISGRIFSADLINEPRVFNWIENYRDLLDTWGLYEERAKFDNMMGSLRNPPKIQKTVFLLCSFCGKSVSLQEESRHRNATAQPNKLSSCPNCRKPLPRCSLCLLYMGCPINSINNTATGSWKAKPFSKWFSWCQTCRHGGHTEHLIQWFSSHVECPVTSCTCKCFVMDNSVFSHPAPKFGSTNDNL